MYVCISLLVQLVASCWNEDAKDRPSFGVILKELNSISPQKGDLMDNLVKMVRIDASFIS